MGSSLFALTLRASQLSSIRETAVLCMRTVLGTPGYGVELHHQPVERACCRIMQTCGLQVLQPVG